jgi:hypothetical protein
MWVPQRPGLDAGPLPGRWISELARSHSGLTGSGR